MQTPFPTPLKGPEPGQKISAPHLSQQPGAARVGWFKRSVAWLLMFTVNIASLGQAVGQVVRGQGGAPYTGFTRSGVYVQGGQMVGNPHQILHDMNNPALWTTGAVSFTNTADPAFPQPSLADIEAAIAVSPEPGGLALSRLYITAPPANPYTLAPPNDATVSNAAAYEQLLLDAQAGGYAPIADGTYIAKTHDSSSPEIANRGLNLYHTKPVFVAAEDPYGGATAFFALQGAQAKNHLSHLQQQNAALLGSSIFFSQQKLPTPQNWGASTDWEGNRIDPGAAFDQALGSIPQNGSNYSVNGNGLTVGYIRPDGQAHDFNLATDPHFRQLQQGQYQYSDSYLPTPNLNELLGQELRRAAEQHNKGQEAAASVDFRYFNEERDIFMQGLDLYRHVNKGDWYLLDGLRTGQITAGHPDYARALALSQDAFRQAYAYHTEHETQLRYTRESAKWQADNADLSRYSDQELFDQLNLYDKKADARGEQLLRDLQAGRLTAGTPEYEEARGLAEARYRVALQKALEPPKKANFFKQLVSVVVAAVVVYFTAGAASVWAAGLTGAATTTTAAGMTMVATTTAAGTISAAGVAAVSIGSAIGAYAGAVVGAGIQSGSLSQALKAGEQSLKGGLAGIVVNTALAASGLNAAGISETLGVSQQAGQAVYNTLTDTLSNMAYGGSLSDALVTGIINAGVDVIAANVANSIGANTDVGSVEKYAAHAALGCGVGAAKSGSGDGCLPAAAGAVAGHMAADGIKVAMAEGTNPLAQMAAAVPGRTLDENVAFWGGLVGGTTAALAGGSSGNVQSNFNLGQYAAENAINNNYLKYDEAKKLQALKDQEMTGQCSGTCKAEIKRLEEVDRQRNEELKACEGSSSAGCQKAFTDVRVAAAEYVRRSDLKDGFSYYFSGESNETQMLARQTMGDFTVWNVVKGAASSVAEGIKDLAGGAYTGFQAVLGNEEAQAKVKETLGDGWGFVSDPANWPQLVGAMSPAQREQLASAYETGNGAAVAGVIGETLTNLPMGGGAGTIKNVAGQLTDLAAVQRLASRADVSEVIQVPAGTKGNWDPRINTGTTSNLSPNAAYVLDNGHAFVTDAGGRVKEVTGDLSLNKMDRNQYQQGCAGASGCAGDDGGHLIASALGGAGDRVNIVPQASTLNRGEWKAMENELAGYLKEGKNVNVKIEVEYPAGGGVRPNKFEVTINVDGESVVREFKQ
ncbi:DNA/RNA non-specific endonuclease [Hydrogenophaga sp. NFH-34]|uniref:DNA/RNA non-specific endonuclease n=1 Tax=Hydrogenophaga sp. NFH-34 TaxID=2744446 RepID=UPI001F27E132|nr:DNA/RNA non-specific endonuclease [Hydrogenophaga sp. NFH-34]